jgi:hypothetical protein
MKRDRSLAGVGGIAFAVSLVAGLETGGPKGGHYSAGEIANFVDQSSTSLIVSVCLFAVSIFGLLVLMAYLSETSGGAGRQSRLAWGTSVAAGASFLIGWGLYLAPPTAMSAGGPAIDPAISYALISAGLGVLYGVGGMLLGIALVSVAIGAIPAPMWVRGFTGVAGFSALVSWAFLLASSWSPNQWLPVPFYVVVLWSLVMGVWLLISSPAPAAPTTVVPLAVGS